MRRSRDGAPAGRLQRAALYCRLRAPGAAEPPNAYRQSFRVARRGDSLGLSGTSPATVSRGTSFRVPMSSPCGFHRKEQRSDLLKPQDGSPPKPIQAAAPPPIALSTVRPRSVRPYQKSVNSFSSQIATQPSDTLISTAASHDCRRDVRSTGGPSPPRPTWRTRLAVARIER
jgi:hypothetical protein